MKNIQMDATQTDTGTTDTVGLLDQTFQHTRRLLASVGPDQYDDPTPCTEWNVRELIEHIFEAVGGIGAAVAGTAPAPSALGDDPVAQFDAIVGANLAAWRADGAMDRVIEFGPGPVPGHVLAAINLLDTATHCWDLATATGQPATLPAELASAALAASEATITPEIRPGRFAPEVEVPADADATSRLVAFLGRTP